MAAEGVVKVVQGVGREVTINLQLHLDHFKLVCQYWGVKVFMTEIAACSWAQCC